MKISRGFVKFFLVIFILLIVLDIIAGVFDFYSNWMGYVLAGFCVFLAILVYNKRYPLFGKIMIFLFLLIILLLLASNFYNVSNLLSDFKNNQTIDNTGLNLSNVTRVITGDSFEIDENKTVSLICVNAPKENDTNAEESREFLSDLILGKQVRLEKDVTDQDY